VQRGSLRLQVLVCWGSPDSPGLGCTETITPNIPSTWRWLVLSCGTSPFRNHEVGTCGTSELRL
jgi:hypothetical protein